MPLKPQANYQQHGGVSEKVTHLYLLYFYAIHNKNVLFCRQAGSTSTELNLKLSFSVTHVNFTMIQEADIS